MATVTGCYFESGSSLQQNVLVLLTKDHVKLRFEDGRELNVVRSDLNIGGKIGKVLRIIELKSGARLEIPTNADIDAILYPRVSLVYYLEQNYPFVALAAIVAIALIVWTYLAGAPKLAAAIVPKLPVKISKIIGDSAIAGIKKYGWTIESEHKGADRIQLIRDLNALPFPRTRIPIQFEIMDVPIPNAFAFPNGTIVFTEELIKLLPTRDHVIAVTWHEAGHIYHEHSMKMLAQSAAMSLVVFAITGGAGMDVGTILLFLLTNGYSREFEAEADKFAAEELTRMGKDPILLAQALEIMENNAKNISAKNKLNDKDPSHLKLLSTHPLTEERLKFLKSYKK